MRVNEIISLIGALCGTIITGLRVYTRITLRRRLPDVADWSAILACAALWVMFGGYHPYYEASAAAYPSADVTLVLGSPEHNHIIQILAFWNTVNGLAFASCLVLSKLSMLLFYQSLSPARWFRSTIWFLIVILIIYTAVTGFAFPLMSISNNEAVFTAFLAVKTVGTRVYAWSNFVMDWLMLCLPAAILVPLQMSLRKKLSIAMLFAFGIIITGIALFRAVRIEIPAPERAAWGFLVWWEFMWRFIIIEGNASVMCASLPLLAQFYSKLWPRYKNKFSGRWRIYRQAQRIDGEEPGFSTTNMPSGSEDNTIIRANKQRRAEKDLMAKLEKNQLQKTESYEMSKPPSTATTAYSADHGRGLGTVYPSMDDEGELLPPLPHRTYWGH